MLEDLLERRQRDKKRWKELDGDLCQLCHAYGPDKRNLFIHCGYAVHEVVPEAIDLSEVEDFETRGYYLRICKTCRAKLLEKMEEWRNERVARRDIPKDHDGEEYWDLEKNIPVRVNGATVMMDEEEYAEYRRRHG
jgi:hypothetical protein